jgi:ELWxxDGT repeat protein
MSRALLPVLFVAWLPAQELVRDIRPTFLPSQTSDPQRLCTVGSWTYFVADDGVHGRELWRTDGTPAGTQLYLDQTPGPAGTDQVLLTAFAGGLAFRSASGLCWSNGTPGHVVVLGPRPANDSTSGRPFVVGARLFYVAETSPFGRELFASDGTPAGTGLVADINPGRGNSWPQSFCGHNGVLYFAATNTGSGTRLWRSDGTAAGTFEVAPAAAYFASPEVAVAGNRVFFGSYVTHQLWQSDGTAAGTSLVRSGFGFGPAGLTGGLGRLAFAAGDASTGVEPWTSDGTPAGTQPLADTTPGPTGGLFGGFTVFGTRALFLASDGTHGIEPWISDLTAAGTAMLLDIHAGAGSSAPSSPAASGTGAFFAADDGSGYELWFTDGTTAGTRLVRDLNPTGASEPGAFTALGALTVFTADDGVHGREPWVTDGTPAGTQLLRDIAAQPLGSDPWSFRTLGKRTLFLADDGVHGNELWVTDGTTGATTLLLDTVPGPVGGGYTPFGTWHGKLWFTVHGSDLWSTDGTPAGTALLLDLAPGLPNIMWFAGLDDRAVIGGELRLFVTDGTAAGTGPLPFLSEGQMLWATRFGDFIYFRAVDAAHGTELWRTDGTAAGTALFFDFNPGPADSLVTGNVVGDRLYLAAASQSSPSTPFPLDIEPWVTDGTVAGTVRLGDLAPGALSSLPGGFVAFAGNVWFAAFGASGVGLFRTDGTPAGTALFRNLVGTPTELTVAGSRLFFANGGELWSTDGTPAGTGLSLDIAPGAASSQPKNHVALGASTVLAFTAVVPGEPRSLWLSDGTAAGTRRVHGLVLDSLTPPLARTGADLFLAANDGAVGRELWALRLRSEGAAIADALGSGCRGAAGVPRVRADTGPRLGSNFTIHLDGAPTTTAAFAVHAFGLLPGGDVAGCAPALDLATGVSLFFLTDGLGHAATSLFVPNAPFALGLEAYSQWVVADPTGHFLGALSLSPVLDWIVGS